MATKAKAGSTLDEVTKDEAESVEQKTEAAPPKVEEEKKPPPLPTSKTSTAGLLEEKIVVIYGPPGVGKSTLASEWAGGGGFFFNVAGELGDLEVFQEAIPHWSAFKQYSWALAESPGQFPCGIIDTADRLGLHCAAIVRQRLGIQHESDLEWGKGWQALRDEWTLGLSKLVALPNFGLVMVTHSTEVEIKTRNATYDKTIFRGVKSVREAMLDMSDLVLFVDFSEGDDEKRIIRTKPSRDYDAKERGRRPRLPAMIEWPLHSNGWDLIKGLWEEGGK